jgi:hypothetical protein
MPEAQIAAQPGPDFAHAALTALGPFCKMAASKHVNNYRPQAKAL